jgi:hypothetical protein
MGRVFGPEGEDAMLRCKVLESIGVRGVAPVVAGIGVCAVLLLAAASAQAHSIHVETKTCMGTEEGRVIKGKLKVSPGTRCTLFGDIVEGDVSVGQAASFFALETVFKENLSSEGAEVVDLGLFFPVEVDGNVSINATSGIGRGFCSHDGVDVSVCLSSSRFRGNVSVTNTSPDGAAVFGNFIAQDLSCTGNAFVTNINALAEVVPNTVLGREFGQCVGL